jgi:transposase
VDESGTHTSMDRLEGESTRRTEGLRQGAKERRQEPDARRFDEPPWVHGMAEAMCVKGATDAQAFEVYIEHFLAPTPRQGQAVVFDELGAHKPQRVRELVEERGAEVLFLPSYSPGLNPIEEAFSKIEGIVRKSGARAHEALTEAIANALSAITPQDAAGWFNHRGYEVEVQYL